MKCGTQIAVLGTQEKVSSTKCGNSYCKKTELSCRGGEGAFLGSSVSSMVASIP